MCARWSIGFAVSAFAALFAGAASASRDLSAAAAAVGASEAGLQEKLARRTLTDRLEALEGERRVLIIFAPNRSGEAFGRQRLIAQRHVVELVEHKIVVIEAAARAGLEDPLGLTALRDRLEVDASEFTVLLLGLSGEPLLRGDEPISAKGLIAALPER